MSDRIDTKNKPGKDAKKESKGVGFLRVMRHPIDSVGDAVDDRRDKKQIKKANEDLYKAALAEVTDWRRQGNEKLGWPVRDFEQFEAKITEAKKAKKDSKRGIVEATNLLAEAKDIGQEADLATRQRNDIKSALGTLVSTIGATVTPQTRKALADVDAIRAALEKPGADLAALTKQVGDLTTSMADVGGDERVGKKRLELQLQLQKLVEGAAVEIALALNDRLGKGAKPVSSTHVAEELEKRVASSKDLLREAADDPAWGDTAARLAGLQDHFNKAKTEVETKIGTFRTDMEADAGKAVFDKATKQQAAYLSEDKRQAAQAKFETAYAPVATALAVLLDKGTPEGAALAKHIEGEKALMIEGRQYAVADRWIEIALGEIRGATNAADEGLAGEGKLLTSEIDALLADLKKQKKAAALLAKPYDALLTEAEQIRALIKTGNAGALVSARQMIDEVKAAGLGAGATAVTAFIAGAAHIKEVADNKAVAKEYPTEIQSLTKALDTVVKAVDLHELAKSSFTLDGLTKQADELVQKQAELERWRRGAKAQLDLLKSDIDKLEAALGGKKGVLQQVRDAIGTSDIYGKTVFGQDYKTVLDGYDKPGVDSAAMQDMLFKAQGAVTAILAKVKAGDAAGGASDLEANKQAATTRADEAAAEQKKITDENARITQVYDALVVTLKATRTKVKDHSFGDKEELDEIEELRNQVKKKLSSKDFDGAKEQLEGLNGLVGRLKKLHDMPGGVTASSINELKNNINGMWQTAQETVRNAFTNIHGKADPIADRLAIDPAAISQRMDELERKLFAFDFFEPVRVLVDEERDIKTRKNAREHALKLVRDARAVLMAHPVAESVRNNPFGFANPFSDYRAFLDSVEYNALRAVPPE